jgi:hypothetical protein
VRRERLTRRHSAVKRLFTRWPKAIEELWESGQAGRSGK